MCLTIKENHYSKEDISYVFRIASKDIKCYKCLVQYNEKSAHSLVHSNFWWEKGKANEDFFDLTGIVLLQGGQVNRGLHAFLRKSAKFTLGVDTSGFDDTSSTSTSGNRLGAYSYTTREYKASMNAKMIIPAGTKYFIGTDGDIVAERMKLVEFI